MAGTSLPQVAIEWTLAALRAQMDQFTAESGTLRVLYDEKEMPAHVIERYLEMLTGISMLDAKLTQLETAYTTVYETEQYDFRMTDASVASLASTLSQGKPLMCLAE